MKRLLAFVLLAVLALALGSGCGEKDKGINSGKDRPKPADQGG
jgi:hypothetical protein